MHKNERKPVVHEYENEQEVVMKVKELELQGIRQDDIYPALTARKSPIGSTNNQWGMNKTPTD